MTHATRGCFFKKLRHGQGVLGVPLHAQVQRLGPLQQQEGVEGRHASSGIAQPLDPCLEDVGQRTEGAGVGNAMVGRIGIGELLEAARGFPVELAAIDQDAANRGAMAADELRRRVDHQVRAQAIGWHSAGDGVVLSMISGKPLSWAIFASFSMSSTSSLGLPTVSE